MADCSLCAKRGCCFEHCCDWETCECQDCDFCLPLGVRIPPSQPTFPEIYVKSWNEIGKDSKRTSDGVYYTSLRQKEVETGPEAEGGLRTAAGAEEQSLPEPKKTAAGSAVFGIRSLKASHK